MSTKIYELPEIMWNAKARDGTWCKAPYPGHPNGCPNFPRCIIKENTVRLSDFKLEDLKWRAIVTEFDLEAHAARMKELHPDWSDRQCKCVLYWQGSVKKILKDAIENAVMHYDDVVVATTCPEALGINVYGTMAKTGLVLYKNPKIVRKIAFFGEQQC
jgi:hypothetical protein